VLLRVPASTTALLQAVASGGAEAPALGDAAYWQGLAEATNGLYATPLTAGAALPRRWVCAEASPAGVRRHVAALGDEGYAVVPPAKAEPVCGRRSRSTGASAEKEVTEAHFAALLRPVASSSGSGGKVGAGFAPRAWLGNAVSATEPTWLGPGGLFCDAEFGGGGSSSGGGGLGSRSNSSYSSSYSSSSSSSSSSSYSSSSSSSSSRSSRSSRSESSAAGAAWDDMARAVRVVEDHGRPPID
jgi:hypothetical protein